MAIGHWSLRELCLRGPVLLSTQAPNQSHILPGVAENILVKVERAKNNKHKMAILDDHPEIKMHPCDDRKMVATYSIRLRPPLCPLFTF